MGSQVLFMQISRVAKGRDQPILGSPRDAASGGTDVGELDRTSCCGGKGRGRGMIGY